jgi:hypothetical protein
MITQGSQQKGEQLLPFHHTRFDISSKIQPADPVIE